MFSMFQGRYTEAGPIYDSSQAIREKVLGPAHPDVANVLYNRGLLLKKQVGEAGGSRVPV